jgi:hypothetical protein
LADQFGAKAYSNPAPAVQPVRVTLALAVLPTISFRLSLSWAKATPPLP